MNDETHGPAGPAPVVVGVDGSAAGLRAVAWAGAEAAARGAMLRIVHAIGIPDFFPGGAISPSTELYHLLERDGDAVLAEAVEAAERLLPSSRVAAESTTDSAVVSLIGQSQEAGVIVVGASGRGAFTGALLGSTSVTLAAHAKCPVVAVRGPAQQAESAEQDQPRQDQPQKDEPRQGTVVVGVDGSELSEDALGCAYEQAASHRSRLVAVHASGDGDPSAEGPPGGEVLDKWLAGASTRFAEVPVQREVVHAKPRQRLLDWSATAELLVVGSRGRGGFRGMLLGSTSQALLHHAECPVMVVRQHCGSISRA